MQSSLIQPLAEVLLVNIVLSGDNAVVIGLAARGLPAHARKRAIILGGGFAVLLRLALTLPAEFLLKVPFLRAGGGLLLAWVAYRLLTGSEEESADAESATVSTAIKLIVLADLTMSLDNILAVAAVAERSDNAVLVLTIGLALSIPIVLMGGSLVARMMGRLPILAWIGAAVLAYTAGELVSEDSAFERVIERVRFGSFALPLPFVVVIVGLGYLQKHVMGDRKKAESHPGTT